MSAAFGSLVIALGGDQDILVALAVVLLLSGVAALATWLGYQQRG